MNPSEMRGHRSGRFRRIEPVHCTIEGRRSGSRGRFLQDYYSRGIKEANLAQAKDYQGFRLVEGNLLTLPLVALVADVEIVFHLAAQAGIRSSWGNDFAVY